MALPRSVRLVAARLVLGLTAALLAAGAVAAHGRVPGGKKKVKLQVKLPGGWHTFASTKSSKQGKFAIAGTLNFYAPR